MKRIVCLAMVLLLASMAAPGWSAGIKSYTPVLTGGTLIDFEGFTEGTLISNQYAGVLFSQHDGGTPQIDDYTWLFGYGNSSGRSVLTGSTTGGAPFPTVAGIVLTFGSPVSDVQAFFSDTAPLGNYVISAYDSTSTLLESVTVLSSETLPPGYSGGVTPAPGTTPLPGIYVGFIRPTSDIAWVQFGPGTAYPNDAFAIDDVRFGSAGVVPVPGAVVLGAMGTGLVGWLRRRRTL